MCAECVDDLDLPLPALVDRLDDRVNKAYGAQPDRLYLVGKDGKIAYAGAPGPRGFDPDEWEAAIRRELGLAAPPEDGARRDVAAALDRDGDGVLSKEEIANASAALRALDRDGDGRLTKDEWGGASAPAEPAPRPGGRRGGFAERLRQLDRDGDGDLTRDELPERMRRRFDRMDANGDGKIDPDEQAAIAERMAGRGRRDR